jgi:urease accessory protein
MRQGCANGILVAMQRVTDIRRAGAWNADAAIDRVVLDSGDRHRRRAVLTGERGTAVLLDRPHPVSLRDGDGLVLEDGGIVAVVGEPEPLAEIGAGAPCMLVSLAWHLGNRHTDVQISGNRIRIRRDHVLEEMVAGLGGSVTPVEALFDPEPGASNGHGDGC